MIQQKNNIITVYCILVVLSYLLSMDNQAYNSPPISIQNVLSALVFLSFFLSFLELVATSGN